MNDGLIDAFRHNAWATRKVLDACQSLSPEQLATTVPGTFGSIIETLRHFISSDGGYSRRIIGSDPEWYARRDEPVGLDELAAWAEDAAARWEQVLATPFDAEQTFVIPWGDDVDRDVPSGILLTQALHHANEHRTQICTTLTTLGVEAPALGVWEFAEETDRAPQRTG